MLLNCSNSKLANYKQLAGVDADRIWIASESVELFQQVRNELKLDTGTRLNSSTRFSNY